MSSQPSSDLKIVRQCSTDIDSKSSDASAKTPILGISDASPSISQGEPIQYQSIGLPTFLGDDIPLLPLPVDPQTFVLEMPSDVVAAASAPHQSGDSNTTSEGTETIVASQLISMKTKGRPPKSVDEYATEADRIRAQNRQSAQARYRDKKKSETEKIQSELENVSQEVERLKLENKKLEGQNALLNNVLSVREDVGGFVKGNEDKSLAEMLPEFSVRLRFELNIALCKANPIAEDACPVTRLSLTEIRAVTGRPAALLAELFQFLVDKLKEVMPRCQQCAGAFNLDCPCLADPNTPFPAATDGVVDILMETGLMYMEENADQPPTGLQKLMSAHMIGADLTDPQEFAHWNKVITALKLTPEQREAMQAPRKQFETRVAEIGARRQQLLSKITKLTVPNVTSIAALEDATCSWIELNETSTELTANLREEHEASMDMLKSGFGEVLTPMQKAVALIASHPVFPDVVSMSKVAAVGSIKMEDC